MADTLKASSKDVRNVSVVTVNYNGERHLPDFFASLEQQTLRAVEVIVVDNGSTDESEALCRAAGATWIPTGANLGLARAYNRGAMEALGEFVFLCNNDMSFAPTCLGELVDALKSEGPNCFSADPLQFSWDGERIIHFGCILRKPDTFRQLFGNTFSLIPPMKRTYIRDANRRDIPFASGGSLMVRKNLFTQLGGFDPTFFTDWEDVDLGWRANRRGWRTVFVPDARLRHKWGATTAKAGGRYSRNGLRLGASQQYNAMRFYLKNYDAFPAVAATAFRIAGAALYLIRGNLPAVLHVVIAVGRLFRTLPDICRARRVEAAAATVSNRALFDRFYDPDSKEQLIWPASALSASN